jgi:hypothetical protein
MLRIHLLALIATNVGSMVFTAGVVLLIKNTPKMPKVAKPRRLAGAELLGWGAEIRDADREVGDDWAEDEYPHAEAIVNRQRFAWNPDTDPAASMRATRRVLAAEATGLRTAAADLAASTPRTGHLAAIYGQPDHYEGAIDAGLHQHLDDHDWDKALARLVALRTETGSWPTLPTQPDPANPWDKPGAPRPKTTAAAAAARMHAAAQRVGA